MQPRRSTKDSEPPVCASFFDTYHRTHDDLVGRLYRGPRISTGRICPKIDKLQTRIIASDNDLALPIVLRRVLAADDEGLKDVATAITARIVERRRAGQRQTGCVLRRLIDAGAEILSAERLIGEGNVFSVPHDVGAVVDFPVCRYDLQRASSVRKFADEDFARACVRFDEEIAVIVVTRPPNVRTCGRTIICGLSTRLLPDVERTIERAYGEITGRRIDRAGRLKGSRIERSHRSRSSVRVFDDR